MEHFRKLLLTSLIMMTVVLALYASYIGRAGGQPMEQTASLVRAEAVTSPPPPRVTATLAATLAIVAQAPLPTQESQEILAPPAPEVVETPYPEVQLQVPNNKQERSLNCEFRSTADLAAYYQWNITWEELFEVVGHSPTGDPNQGFVGSSMDDPAGSLYPRGYGVYASPVARGLRRLGIDATAHTGQTVEWLKQKVSDGHPIVVWARAGMLPGTLIEWNTTDGVTVQGVSYEHTFTIVGYNDDGVWVNDPYTATTDFYPWQQFTASWAILGNMALTIDEPPPAVTPVPQG